MKLFSSIFVLLHISLIGTSQAIERKIVIQNNKFYYTTIDLEFQMATLHTGNYSDALKTAKSFALPAGRNYSEPIIPFSWDIFNASFYAVNFIMNPMNDRNEALKRFPLADLKEWSKTVTIQEMIAKSVDQNIFAYNDPYQFVIKRSNILSNFYFDGVALNDSSYYMAISNNEELTIWNYSGNKWEHSEVFKKPVDAYFSLFTNKGNVFILLNNGKLYNITSKTLIQVENKNENMSLADGALIVNRDDSSVKFIKNNQITMSKSLKDLIKNNAVTIF